MLMMTIYCHTMQEFRHSEEDYARALQIMVDLKNSMLQKLDRVLNLRLFVMIACATIYFYFYMSAALTRIASLVMMF